MLLEGKSIVVTGGNSGIGKAIVLAAAAEGANVVVDYRMHPDYAAEVVAAAGRAGGRAVGVEADVSHTEDLRRVIRAAVENFGRLDVLVSNAGIETRTSLLETSEADFDKVLAVNLKSAFFGAQFAAQQFVAQRSGGLTWRPSPAGAAPRLNRTAPEPPSLLVDWHQSEMPEPNARSTYSALCEGEYAPPWWYRSFRPRCSRSA